MKHFVLLIGLLSLGVGTANAQTSTDRSRADSLFNDYEEKQALNVYNQILEENPDNLNALWHSSILYSRIGNRLESEAQKKEYFNLAKDRAQRALELDSTDSQANFAMAVAMGRMALIAGARERLAASRDIKKYAERALRADSSNAGAWHVLGRWNYEISNLNFAERLAANVLFGGIPSGASTEKAVDYINKAIDLKPQFVLYYYDLARAYQALGNEKEAIEACQKALDRPVLAPGDQNIKEDCRDLVDDLQ